MKKFLKILTTALGSLMVVCPQFDVYGMKTIVRNDRVLMENQIIKEVESFIKNNAENRYIMDYETRHVATAVARSILNVDDDNVFLDSLNDTYDGFINNWNDDDFCRIMGLLNAWIGYKSVYILRDKIISTLKNGLLKPELNPEEIYGKSVEFIWKLLMEDDSRYWINIVKNRFYAVYPDCQQEFDSNESLVKYYFSNDWNQRFKKSNILNFAFEKILEMQNSSTQTTSTKLELLKNNKRKSKIALTSTTVRTGNNGSLSKGRSKHEAHEIRSEDLLLKKGVDTVLLNYFNENNINIPELSQSQKESGIIQKKIVKKDNKNNVNKTSMIVDEPREKTLIQNNFKHQKAKLAYNLDKKDKEKPVNNTGTATPVIVLGTDKTVPPPPNVAGLKMMTIEEGAQCRAKNKVQKNTNNAKTGGKEGVVSSNSGSQNTVKTAPKVQSATIDIRAQVAAKAAQMKKAREIQNNVENTQAKGFDNNIVLPKLRNKGVEQIVETDYTKANSIKNLWAAYNAVCVKDTIGAGNMGTIVNANGVSTKDTHLDKKSILISKPQAGLNAILASANILPVEDFETFNISKTYDVDETNNIVNFDAEIKNLERKEFARLLLFYVLKGVDQSGKISILDGKVEKKKTNEKRITKYCSKKETVNGSLFKKTLIPVFSYQYQSENAMFQSIKLIGFKEFKTDKFKNFDMMNDSDLLAETNSKKQSLARNQLYAILYALLYKKFDRRWFEKNLNKE